jgi:DNA-binding GntR family transcriptional regulator
MSAEHDNVRQIKPRFVKDEMSPVCIYEQFADWLAERITAGDLEDKLPNERRLAEDHNVSLGTVRRTARLLDLRGLVTISNGKGVYIRKREQRALGSDVAGSTMGE